VTERTLPLEALYTGYRKNVMAPDELLVRIEVPAPTAHEYSRAYKISKRFDCDISALCAGIAMDLDGDTVRQRAPGLRRHGRHPAPRRPGRSRPAGRAVERRQRARRHGRAGR